MGTVMGYGIDRARRRCDDVQIMTENEFLRPSVSWHLRRAFDPLGVRRENPNPRSVQVFLVGQASAGASLQSVWDATRLLSCGSREAARISGRFDCLALLQM